MAKRLQVPKELEHLIEKRDTDTDDDRRSRDERGSERRGEDLGPLGAIESTPDLRDVPTEERRASGQRRAKDRRGKSRRKSG